MYAYTVWSVAVSAPKITGVLFSYLEAEEVVRMVSGDFTSLYHKVLQLFVNFSWRVLPREQIAYRVRLSTTMSTSGDRAVCIPLELARYALCT